MRKLRKDTWRRFRTLVVLIRTEFREKSGQIRSNWPGVIVNPVPPIFCIPVRNSLVNMVPPYDSLVNCVWGYRIPVGYFVSPYVSPTWILYPPTDSTTTLRRSSRNVSANDLESWGNGQLFLWQRIATRTLDLT